MRWTPGKVKKLTELWEQGKTGSEIAKALGGGVTRSAVIGKARRLKLSPRPSPLKRKAEPDIIPVSDDPQEGLDLGQ